MSSNDMNTEVSGELSAAEAALMGAFSEDALSVQAALDSLDDEVLSPAEMHSAVRLADNQ